MHALIDYLECPSRWHSIHPICHLLKETSEISPLWNGLSSIVFKFLLSPLVSILTMSMDNWVSDYWLCLKHLRVCYAEISAIKVFELNWILHKIKYIFTLLVKWHSLSFVKTALFTYLLIGVIIECKLHRSIRINANSYTNKKTNTTSFAPSQLKHTKLW